MTIFISRDYNPITTSYNFKHFTQPIYELSVFLHRVLGYSIVGNTGLDIDIPLTTLTVTGASNTYPIEITTSTPHGLSNNQGVFITGVGGNTAANGSWVITVTAADKFTLISSLGNGAFTSGGTVTTGFVIASGLVADGYGAGINFGAGAFYEVSIPVAKRTVIAGDIGRMLVLKSNSFPTKNAGCFKISAINAGANRYVIDYRSTENPPVEATNSIDWWLYEIENVAQNQVTNHLGAGGVQNPTGATNTTPIQLTGLSTAHASTYGMTTGQRVVVSGIGGNTAANGTWTITDVNSTTISLNGSVGNGTYTSGGTIRLAGYSGDAGSYCTRIILQSPHPSGWQVRIAAEPTSSNYPLFTVAIGYGGNSIGDFPVGGTQTHTASFFDVDTSSANPEYANLTVGGGEGAVHRMTIVGDDKSVMFWVRPGSGSTSGIYHFGIPDNEPAPTPPNEHRIFTYGGVGNNGGGNPGYGTIALRIGAGAQNIGVAFRNSTPKLCALTGWANLDGTSSTSPMFHVSAADCPFTASTELLPIEIWNGITGDVSLSGGTVPPFFFDQYFMGTSPLLRSGRNNFGNFTLTTEETTSRTVTAATNTSPIQITTSVPNALVTGQTVTVSGVGGNTAANGTWVITVINTTNFTLNGSVGNGTYTSGGTLNGCPGWLHLQNGVYLKWNGAFGLNA